MTTPPVQPLFDPSSCKAATRLVKLLDANGWRYDVQTASGWDDAGNLVDSVGVSAAHHRRRVVAMWQRKPVEGDREKGKWARTPGYIWGPITSSVNGVTVWAYLVACSQAEMNAWVDAPDTWWTDFLPKRAMGTWGFMS